MFKILHVQGQRPYQEDSYLISENFYDGYNIYAIFDGHGGDLISKMCQKHFVPVLLFQLSQNEGKIPLSLHNTFIHLDKMFDINESFMTGTTCLVILHKKNILWVAHCGDSRAIVNVKNTCEDLTIDHKPINDEKLRIENLGGVVLNIDGVWRVGGELAVSRAIGDSKNKPFVTCVPEIRKYNLNSSNKFFLLATDGLWDIKTSHEVNQLVESVYENHSALPVNQLLHHCMNSIYRSIERNIVDNTTIILVNIC